MEINFSDMIWPESIMQNTVTGWIFIRPEFIYFIYFLAILIIAVSANLLRKKYGLKVALRKAVILSLACTALLYASAYEFIWSRWLLADLSSFHDKSGDDKQVALNGDFYRFIAQCKKIIGTDSYSLYPDSTADPDLHFKFATLQYYLLPARKKSDASYLIVLSGGSVRFDEKAGLLYAGDKVTEKVKMCYMFSPDVYLLRVGK